MITAVLALSSLLIPAQLSAQMGNNSETTDNKKVIEWSAQNVPEILEVFGQPNVIETKLGPAVEFNGVSDGVFVNSLPLKGMTEFTIEMIFNQYGQCPFEQRFFHLGSMGARVLFETRVLPDDTWYFDAYLNLGRPGEAVAIIDPELLHPTDRWYNVTMVAGPEGIKSYVNGELQGTSDLKFSPVFTEGITSVGVRQNKVCWFKGAVYKVRFTDKVLEPKDFLTDYKELNR